MKSVHFSCNFHVQFQSHPSLLPGCAKLTYLVCLTFFRPWQVLVSNLKSQLIKQKQQLLVIFILIIDLRVIFQNVKMCGETWSAILYTNTKLLSSINVVFVNGIVRVICLDHGPINGLQVRAQTQYLYTSVAICYLYFNLKLC